MVWPLIKFLGMTAGTAIGADYIDDKFLKGQGKQAVKDKVEDTTDIDLDRPVASLIENHWPAAVGAGALGLSALTGHFKMALTALVVGVVLYYGTKLALKTNFDAAATGESPELSKKHDQRFDGPETLYDYE